MTADGELFVDENLRDEVFKEVEEKIYNTYGEMEWRLNGNRYSNYWSAGDLPKVIEAEIVMTLRNGEERSVGMVTAKLKFVVEGEEQDKWIDAVIDNYEIKMYDKPKPFK